VATNNIETAKLVTSVNTDPKSLQPLFDGLVAKADSTLGWYEAHQRRNRNRARAIRATAIALGALTAMIPVLISVLPDGFAFHGVRPQQLGALATLFGLAAGALVAFDRLFGFSSAWVRYITTYQQLQTVIEKFQLAWCREQLRAANALALLDLLAAFSTAANDLVRNETAAWATEFTKSISDLDRHIESQRAAGQAARPRTGALKLAVSDVTKLDGGKYMVYVGQDAAGKEYVNSDAAVFDALDEGITPVRVTATLGGKVVNTELLARIEADKIFEQTIKLA
jgi:SMODS and SLOG-associating 2TM effector domain 2